MSNAELIAEAKDFLKIEWPERGIVTARLLIDRLVDALETQGWQPIETAPDQMFILVCDLMGDQFVAIKARDKKSGGMCWEYADLTHLPIKPMVQFICVPTHWRPLPAPPETGNE